MEFNSGFKGLNGLVHFVERRNLVSAHVPSHFKRSLTAASLAFSVIAGSFCHLGVKS